MKKTFLLITLVLQLCYVSFAQEEIYDDVNKNRRKNSDTESYDELPSDNSSTKSKTNNTNSEDENTTDEEEIPKKFDPSKLRIGGRFGLQFGSYTFVNISPTAGYLFLKDRLEVGAGPIFIYQSIRYANNYRQKSFVYGADLYGRGYIWKGIFAQAQYDFVNKESYFEYKRVNVHHLLIGGGYAQPIGDAASFYFSLMYNVIRSDESIYQGTFGKIPLMLNIGFGIGINRRR
ncbi:MAG: hypothetical protein IPK18_12475 [Sphingobacteriales bacterium]|nr:MAG: hypothetical protein IPK18_12475 [Sphingobacteriales bacterium]